MKRILRLLVIVLVISSLAGITSSCAIFEDSSHAQKLGSFKHKDPLPKKYIISNDAKPILK